LCSIRIIKKVPDLAENFINPAAALLKEKHHGVLITGVQLCTDLCKVSSEALEHFRKVNQLTEATTSHHAPKSFSFTNKVMENLILGLENWLNASYGCNVFVLICVTI